MWEYEGQTHGGNRDHSDDATILQDVLKIDGFVHIDQSWYVTSEVPSDLLVRVGDSSFHLHKYPLLSRSGKMNRIIYEAEVSKIDLGDIPGGAESFELAAKFCYGIAVDLTASNISGLRCAAEYLEMTEDLEEGNLIFKTEAFLSYVVLSSWRDSIVVLKSCESLSSWAENLQIVRRCSESIAWKACANPRGIRRAYTGKPPKRRSPKWPPDAAGSGSSGSSESSSRGPPETWWFEDVSLLRIDHFVKVVTAIKVKGMRPELIGAAITRYAGKWLPGLAKEKFASGEESGGWSGQGGLHMVVAGGGGGVAVKEGELAGCGGGGGREQRMVVESLISIIPPQKDCVQCGFLLRVLRLANMLKVAPALVTELEKRVGMQLEQASLTDLLIPSFGCSEAMYDVDLVQRLVEHFLVQEHAETSSPEKQIGYEGGLGVPKATKTTASTATPSGAKMRVARLLDSYLTEVSRDRNLSLTKFQVLAEALPDSARTCDDGLYRAVDSYLKAHSMLSEHERKRLCRVMDCQKLSIDACMHAAQNERLPIRVVVQVLFSEQVKISNIVAANSSMKDLTNDNADHHHQYQPMISTRKQLLDATPHSFQEGWAMAKKDINTLKFELESMKAKYLELQNDMDCLQRQFGKLPSSSKPSKGSSGWSSGWKKLGRLKKISGMEGNVNVGGGSGATTTGEEAAEQARKGPRRWRNSIS